MTKIKYVLFAIMAVSLAVSAVVFVVGDSAATLNLTVVATPPQAAPEWPPAVPDPMANMVALPDSPNLAESRPVTASSFTDVYVASNAVDGHLTSYWESNGFPAEFTIDLGTASTISTIAVSLNPSLLWEERTQNFEVLTSTDGTNFTTLLPNAPHTFDPLTGNAVRLDFAPTAATHVQLIFTSNTAARTNGAQAAEIMVFE